MMQQVKSIAEESQSQRAAMLQKTQICQKMQAELQSVDDIGHGVIL
jgi:hypothetical protein